MNNRPQKVSRNKDKIIQATIEVLEENNYSTLTIEQVAARAGVGKSTIYRWWNDKAALVFDAFLSKTDILFKHDSKQTIYEHFISQLNILTEVLNSPVGRAMLTIVTERKDLSSELYQGYFSPRRAESRRILQLGIDRGELKEDIDFELTLDLLYGPIYFQFIVFNNVPNNQYIENLVTTVIQAIKK